MTARRPKPGRSGGDRGAIPPGTASGAGAGAASGAFGAGARAFGARAPRWLPLALVLAGTVVLYLPALHTQFFADDFLFLDQVRDRSLWDAIRAPDPLSNFFRPVSRQLYFWAIAGATNESPLAFRIGNLITLLAAIAVLFALARRLAGARAATIAAAFWALHYVADVPVRWACGSQELLAVLGALAAIHLHGSGRRIAAGVAMLAAAFSKEVVLLAPAIALLADRAPREPWARAARRAWPLAAAVLIWAVTFLAMPHRRVAQSTEVEFDLLMSPLAALAHLFQVVPGMEWLPGRLGALPRALPPLLPTLAALVAIAIAWRQPAKPAPAPHGREPAGQALHVLRVAALWILVATAPVAAVALLWSSYYYLFAMAGVALALGVLLARAPSWAACGACALLAWGSAHARTLGDFGVGRDAWTPVSHINLSYIERSNRITERYVAWLRRTHPSFPPGSTVFFAGLKPNIGFQRADGPLLRWAYRDGSLRSHFLNAFSHQTARTGPLYFFVGEGDSLAEMAGGDDLFLRIAFGMIVSEHPESARDALEIAAQRLPEDTRVPYMQSWVSLSLGDSASARRQLTAARQPPVAGAPAMDAGVRDAVVARFAAGDTAGAIRQALDAVRANVLDAGAHGLLADLLLIRSQDDALGAIEAFAARVLAPREAYVWRRWATVQAVRDRHIEALGSFQAYFQLGGEAAAADTEARQWVDRIRARMPKGFVVADERPAHP